MTALNEKAILVSVKTKKFTATVKNRDATAEFATDKQTTSEWVNITQRLVAKSVIDGPRKIAERGKNYLRGVSPGEFDGEFLRGGLPYWGQNVHILPNTLSSYLACHACSRLICHYLAVCTSNSRVSLQFCSA